MLATVVLGVIAGAWWYASGGRWLVVQTPSMGQAAPVGTLLWVEHVDPGDLRVGDIVSFSPPGSPSTYTHRIAAIAADGTITTKGDANATTDPWQLAPAAIKDRVAARWWAVGWLIRAAPILAVGAVLINVLVRRFTAPRWRVPAATVSTAVLVTLPIWIYRPLIGAQLVTFGQDGDGGARATYISTGLLPVRLSAPDAPRLILDSGATGSIVTRHLDASGRFTADLAPHLPWWLWAVVLGACFVPALWSLAAGSPSRRQEVEGTLVG